MAEIPEFGQLKKPSPFSLNNIVGLFDESTGEEVNEDSIKQLMKMAEIMRQKYENASDKKVNNQNRSARKHKEGKHHRNLASSDDNGYLTALEKLDSLLYSLRNAKARSGEHIQQL